MSDPIPSHAERPEFSRPLKVSGLPEGGLNFRDVADVDERAALAARYGVVAVKRFAVEGKLRVLDRGWRLTARVTARITQSCVATLAPVDQILDEPFERRYAPGAPELDDLLDLDIDADDPPEPLGREIDPGEAAAETAALALDAYPRAAGADPVNAAAAPDGEAPMTDEDVRPKPFAGLAALKEKLEKGGDKS
ncbi:MAG: uncharacterized metal-binding protein YceD (DUF177 family) [Paracoccaceae bacterium]|jgi:uncharacterized metal-binding protein YceD (DUF177 family)